MLFLNDPPISSRKIKRTRLGNFCPIFPRNLTINHNNHQIGNFGSKARSYFKHSPNALTVHEIKH